MSLLEIACDESGSEGENLASASSRVFVHASTVLSVEAARSLMDEVRRRTGAQGEEVKSTTLLHPRHRALLTEVFDPDGPLAGQCAAMVADKEFFLVAKVVDLLVEELAYAEGRDIHGSGEAVKWARALHREGRRALGEPRWNELLKHFNSLTRIRQRKGGPKTTVEEFFAVVNDCRFASHRKNVTRVLSMAYLARPHAESFQQRIMDDPMVTPDLDPVIPGIVEAARHWYHQHQEPVVIVHDRQAVLSDSLIAKLLHSVNHPLPEFARKVGGRVRLTDVRQVDSRDDPRVQVADLVAGVVRAEATAALTGTAPREINIQGIVLAASPWSDDPSWQSLTGSPIAS